MTAGASLLVDQGSPRGRYRPPGVVILPHLAQFLSVYLTVKVFSPVITVSYCRVIRLSVNLGWISPPHFRFHNLRES